MSESSKSRRTLGMDLAAFWRQLSSSFGIPLLAILTALILGALVIWFASGSLSSVGSAYDGLVRGAFFKQRGFSESLVATTPYILLSLGLAVGFKSGLFNIGAEGQYDIGAVGAAWVGVTLSGLGLPAIIYLPLTLLTGALCGAIWAGFAGFLKAKTGAHEVISTMMMNYIAFRLVEFLVSGPLRDPNSGIDQTKSVAANAELWTLYEIPKRLQDPLNALGAAILFALLIALVVRVFVKRSGAAFFISKAHRRQVYLGAGLFFGIVVFFALPPLTQAWWPFNDPADRLHIGLFLALGMAVVIWWLLQRTTLGFELRTVGANPNAAKYAGVNITRNIVVAMAISGGLAGLAGTMDVLGVNACRCEPVVFVSGYGWDSIAIALLARNNPFGIIASGFIWGAMRNGADLMELTSGVSKYIISMLQAFVLLFVSAPTITRWIYRLRAEKKTGPEATLTSGWGGGR